MLLSTLPWPVKLIGPSMIATLRRAAAALALILVGAGAGQAAQVAPHHAAYELTLDRSTSASDVTDVSGTMDFEWADSCNGWTVKQKSLMTVGYSTGESAQLGWNLLSWEAKDGLKYRFNQKETRNGTDNDEIRGEAKLDGPDKGGTVNFEKPEAKTLKLPAGTLFPSAHTISLIDKAKAGENFISKLIFDGATMENSVLVTAVIGAKVEPDEESAKKSPLLNRPGWRVQLAFFPADQKAEKPDYQLGMVLLDNGVSRDMVIDYGEYSIRAKLDDIEALPKPKC
jgi:EipB-like